MTLADELPITELTPTVFGWLWWLQQAPYTTVLSVVRALEHSGVYHARRVIREWVDGRLIWVASDPVLPQKRWVGLREGGARIVSDHFTAICSQEGHEALTARYDFEVLRHQVRRRLLTTPSPHWRLVHQFLSALWATDPTGFWWRYRIAVDPKLRGGRGDVVADWIWDWPTAGLWTVELDTGSERRDYLRRKWRRYAELLAVHDGALRVVWIVSGSAGIRRQHTLLEAVLGGWPAVVAPGRHVFIGPVSAAVAWLTQTGRPWVRQGHDPDQQWFEVVRTRFLQAGDVTVGRGQFHGDAPAGPGEWPHPFWVQLTHGGRTSPLFAVADLRGCLDWERWWQHVQPYGMRYFRRPVGLLAYGPPPAGARLPRDPAVWWSTAERLHQQHWEFAWTRPDGTADRLQW